MPKQNNKLARLARIFHLLGADCKKNIDIILEQACHTFDGVCSLYNRIDDREKSLMVWAAHNPPDDLEQSTDAGGHICYEATIKGMYKPVVLENLETTEFFESDPYVKKYNLKSYLGHPVKCRNQVIGSLCVVDTRIRKFTEDDIHCIQTLAAALSLEEERLALQETVQEEKERYQTLVENADDAIYIIQDCLIKFPNPKAQELSGYPLAELENLPAKELAHPDDLDSVKAYHESCLSNESCSAPFMFRAVNKPGDTFFVQINAAPIQWEGKPAVLYFARDLTRFKELEEKLHRAEKMEVIGTMAGGVAHDLNNILSGLVSYPELLLMQLEPDSPLADPITFMLESGLKAADIVQDLLTLTRRGVSIEEVVNLNTLADEYFNSVSHRRLEAASPDIEFAARFDPDLLNVKASPAHITKIVMNLVINAAEAVGSQGRVTIETFNQYIDIPLSGYDTIEEGDYVVLRVTDTGSGIPEEMMNQIFEPFFTKKQMGRSGSGLGLSVVWNSVKDHCGYVEVNNRPESGTVFEVYLPATRENTGEKPDDFNLNHFKGNNETILVIDDIKGQRRIAKETLTILGYHPTVAESGEKALQILATQKFDLVLLDMIMDPGIDGLQTYAEILEIHPEQKAIIASGFSENDRVRETLRLGAGQYVKKPYTIKNLAHAIQRELHPQKSQDD